MVRFVFKVNSMQEDLTHFFNDLNVVELSSVLAGPSVGMFFAEMGANVTKIENERTDGDVTRKWRTKSDHRKISSYFASVNYGKKYVQLNLLQSDDKKRLHEYVSSADVILTNLKLGDDKKLGITYEFFKSIKNDIIQCQLYGFESDKSRPAFDAVLQAETGFMSMNGHPNSPPTKFPVALIDLFAAHQMKEAILIALLKKARTGLGSYIEVSLEKAGLASLANQATNWLMNRAIPGRIGSIHPSIAPYGETFQCKDGIWVVLAVGTDRQFKEMMSLLNLQEMITHPNYCTNEQRVMHRKQLAELLSNSFAQQDSNSICTQLKTAGVPFGKVKNVKDVLESEVAQSMTLMERIDGDETARLSSIGFRFLA